MKQIMDPIVDPVMARTNSTEINKTTTFAISTSSHFDASPTKNQSDTHLIHFGKIFMTIFTKAIS